MRYLARVWLPVLGATAAVAAVDRRTEPTDLRYFVHAGEQLLSAGWADTFADRSLQSGPLQLLLFGAVGSVPALAFVLEFGVAALLLLVLRRLGAGERAQLVVGLAAVATGLTHAAFVDGHPAEIANPLLWVVAALWAREGRTAWAGALIGASAGLELWGVLGAPVLLLAPQLRAVMRGLLAQAGVVLALLAPFALAGRFEMFAYEWKVAGGTLLGLVLQPGSEFGWSLRLLQAAVATGLGGAVVLRFRRTLHAIWLAPLAVVLTRILLDPLAYGWYWLEVEALALVGAAIAVPRLLSLVREGREVRVQDPFAPEECDDGPESQERPERDAHLPRLRAVAGE